MAIAIKCSKKEPNTKLFSTRDFVVYTDERGSVFVNTSMTANQWTSKEDEYQFIVFTNKKTSQATEHTVVYENFDFKVIELQSNTGKNYLVMRKPGGGKR
jgi:hypothetical protein